MTPPAPTRPPRRCQNCQRPVDSLKRGRCAACYAYWYHYGRERPPHLWWRSFTGPLDER
jgi:hypothetical protein